MTARVQRIPSALQAVLIGAACSHAQAASLHTDDFESGLASWNSGGSTVVRLEDGGPAGAGDAFVQVTSTSNLALRNSSAAWNGDLSSREASRVTADLMAPDGETDLEIRLVLFGSGFIQAADRWVSTTAAQIPADGVWRKYDFSLAEADFARVQGTGTHADLMSDVQQVMLRHGGVSSGGSFVLGTLGIDNVTLAKNESPMLIGDYNGDGEVNAEDLTVWQTNFGASGGEAFALGDGDGDGDSDGADFLIWQRERGKRSLASSTTTHTSASVPEPSAVRIAVLGIAMALSHRIQLIATIKRRLQK